MNRTYQATFAAGEIAPELAGRLDLTTFTNGLLRCRNVVVKPQGSLFKRPGFRFIRKVKDSTKKTRLIAFRYGAGQNMLIELGAGYFRFFQNGAVLEASPGVPYEIANPYAEADLFAIDYTQSFDVMTLTHPSYAARELRRVGPTNWTLTNVNTSPVSISPTATISETHGFEVQCTRDSSDPLRWNLGGAVSGSGARGSGLIIGDTVWASLNTGGGGFWGNSAANPNGIYVVTEAIAAEPPAVRLRPLYSIVEAVGGASAPNNTVYIRRTKVGNAIGFGTLSSTNETYYYQLTAVFADGSESLPFNLPTATADLDIEGSKVTFTWTAVPNAVAYRVYRKEGAVYGLLGETTGSFTDNGKQAPDFGRTPPKSDGVSYGNPAACGYYEQRRVFAGFSSFPQDGLMTRTGTESDMTFRAPGLDDDRIAFRVSSRQASSIRFILPLAQMVLLTDEDVFRLTPLNNDALTPESVAVRPQGGFGAAKVRPAITGNVALYVAERGSHILEIGWQNESLGYVPRDLSLRAPHLVEARRIVDFAFLQSPAPIGFGAASDGRLLGMTYVPEERVGGWHWHDSPSQASGDLATFESVAQIPEGDEDALYVVVRRILGDGGGGTEAYRCIERLESLKTPTDEADERFLDSHLTFDGNTAPAGVTLTFVGGALIGTGVGYTVTSSSALFALSSVGRFLCLYEATPAPNGFGAANTRGRRHFFEVVGFTSSTVVTVRMVNDSYIINGTNVAGPAHSNWAWAEDTLALPHLPGAVIYALADGRPVGPLVTDVSTGVFTLPFPAVKVVAGLPYVAEIQTLAPAVQAEGLTQGRTRAVNKVALKLLRSGGYYVGNDPNAPTSQMSPVNNAFDAGFSGVGAAPISGPFFFDGEAAANAPAKWRPDLGVYIRQVSPLPLRVLGMALDVQIGGT